MPVIFQCANSHVSAALRNTWMKTLATALQQGDRSSAKQQGICTCSSPNRRRRFWTRCVDCDMCIRRRAHGTGLQLLAKADKAGYR